MPEPTTPDDTPPGRPRHQRFLRHVLLFLGAIATTVVLIAIYSVGGRLIRRTKDLPEHTRIRNTVRQVQLAVQNYVHDYDRYPATTTDADIDLRTDPAFMAVLMGEDTNLNPRETVYISPKPANAEGRGGLIVSVGKPGSLVDVWGTPFYLRIDTDGDGSLLNPDPTSPIKTLHASILVYSAGPDRDPATWHDNITSWR